MTQIRTTYHALRITLDYTAGAQQGAGIGRYTRELIRALATLDQTTPYTLLVRGQVTVSDALTGFPPNFRLRRIPVSNIHFIRVWRLGLPLPMDWLAGRANLYYSPDFILPPLTSGCSLVTVHDLTFLRVPETADPRLRAFLTRAVPHSVTRANHILADSVSTKADLTELLGVAPTKISVIYPGVASRFRRIDDPATLADVRARYQLDGPFILGLGTLEPRKNLSRLIEAFARLRTTGAPHTLALAGGRGWLFDPIFAQVERLGVQDRVRFLGYVDDNDLPALYSLADAFAFPSLYEGFGLPPLEALACGTPTVVSNTSSLPEVVGDAALLVPPTDVDALAAALHRLVTDEALRAHLRTAGPAQASPFTWAAAAQGLHDVFHGLLQRR